jgi:S1-C subfamily serine protease
MRLAFVLLSAIALFAVLIACSADQAKPLAVSVDDQPVQTLADFAAAIESKDPGKRVVLKVTRDGQERRIPIELEAGS